MEEAASMKLFQLSVTSFLQFVPILQLSLVNHCREQAMVSASTLPILKRSGGRAERYPNVYDSLADAKNAAGNDFHLKDQ